MQSCGTVCGLLFLVITDTALVISFVAPFWATRPDEDQGLWATCDRKQCKWIFVDGRDGVFNTEWMTAVQWLMTSAVALGVLSLLVASISMCCRNSSFPHRTVGGLLLLTFFVSCAALTVFAVKTMETFDSDVKSFGWSFWLAAGASVLSLLTAGIYRCAAKGE